MADNKIENTIYYDNIDRTNKIKRFLRKTTSKTISKNKNFQKMTFTVYRKYLKLQKDTIRFYSDVDVMLNLFNYYTNAHHINYLNGIPYCQPLDISIKKLSSVIQKKSLISILSEHCISQEWEFNFKNMFIEISYNVIAKYCKTENNDNLHLFVNNNCDNYCDSDNDCDNDSDCCCICDNNYDTNNKNLKMYYVIRIYNNNFYYKNHSKHHHARNNSIKPFKYHNILCKKKNMILKSINNDHEEYVQPYNYNNIIYKIYNIDKNSNDPNDPNDPNDLNNFENTNEEYNCDYASFDNSLI